MSHKTNKKTPSINFNLVASVSVIIVGGGLITSGLLNSVQTENAFASQPEAPQVIMPPAVNPPSDYLQPEENVNQNVQQNQQQNEENNNPQNEEPLPQNPQVIMPPAVNPPSDSFEPNAQTDNELQIITVINKEIQEFTKTQQRILDTIKNIFN